MKIVTLSVVAWFSAVALCMLLCASAAAAGSKSCLTGTVPEAVFDLPQVISTRVAIESSCDCAGYDGSDGKARADYLVCVKAEIKAAVLANALRDRCAATVKKYFVKSICGAKPNLNVAPCIARKIDGGKLKCAIKATTKSDGVTPSGACESTDGTVQVSCPGYDSCIDAADTNGDLILDGTDSGSCVLPASPTATETPTPTSTPTPSSTPTATSTPICGDGIVEGGEQCDLGDQNGEAGSCCSASCGAAAPATSCDDGDACTSNDQCDGSGGCAGTLIPLTAPQIDEVWFEDFLGNPDGVSTITIEGSVDNLVVAHVTDHSACHGAAAPTFQWIINTPTVNGYSARGIRGYRDSQLEVDADSIPNFAPHPMTFKLIVTNSVGSVTNFYRVIYRNSALTFGMSTICQQMMTTGNGCDIEAALAVLPGTLV